MTRNTGAGAATPAGTVKTVKTVKNGKNVKTAGAVRPVGGAPVKGKAKGKAGRAPGSGPRSGAAPAPVVIVARSSGRKRTASVLEHVKCTLIGCFWIAMIGIEAAAIATAPFYARALVVCAGLCATTWAWAYIFPPTWPRWRSLAAVAVVSTVMGAFGLYLGAAFGPATALGSGILVLAWCHPGFRTWTRARLPWRRPRAGSAS